MSEPASKPIAPSVPLAILAGGAVAVVWVLIRFWGANPEYVDRFLILAASAWIAWQARPELIGPPIPASRLATSALPRFGRVSGRMVPPGKVRPEAGVQWWLTVSWVLAASGYVLIAGGWSHLRRLAFPLAFILFALPIPNRLLVPLQFALQSATTSASAAILPLVGVPVERNGFVLSLPNGDLGVAEACSGVRSVTALTAIAAFVAWWRGFGFIRGMSLVVLSVPVIAGVNAVRVVVSGLIQEHVGSEYVRGHWHEALGIAMVLLGLALIVGLASLLARLGREGGNSNGSESKEVAQAKDEDSATRPRHSIPSSVVLACSLAATVAAQFLGTGVEQELIAAAPIDQIPQRIGRWKGTDLPVPDEIKEVLTADAILHREYRELGYEVTVWIMYWSSRNMVKGYHHPDVCWKNRGFRQESRDLIPISTGGGTVPITVREFSRESGGRSHRQLILYWTQEGRASGRRRTKRVQAAGDSHDWLGERLFRREPPALTGRIVVLIGTPTWADGKAIREQTLDFSAKLADEVYRVCPGRTAGRLTNSAWYCHGRAVYFATIRNEIPTIPLDSECS